MQYNCIHHAKDRCSRSNRECQRKKSRRCEHWRSHEYPKTEFNISPNRTHSEDPHKNFQGPASVTCVKVPQLDFSIRNVHLELLALTSRAFTHCPKFRIRPTTRPSVPH